MERGKKTYLENLSPHAISGKENAENACRENLPGTYISAH